MLTKDNFTCENCGECCKTYTVKLTEAEVMEIEKMGYHRGDFCERDDFDLDAGSFALLQRDGKCVFLISNNNKFFCKIYDKRPRICVDYPFNGTDEADDCKPQLPYKRI